MSAQKIDGQVFYCSNCGTPNLQPVEVRTHAKRGSGSTTYVIKNLNKSHKNALVALFNLGASNLDQRRALPDICAEIKRFSGRFPNRNGVGGRLSELQRIEFVKCYSKVQVTDEEIPEYRDQGSFSGWYLQNLGLRWCRGSIQYTNQEIKESNENRKVVKTLWENGHAVNREEVIVE